MLSAVACSADDAHFNLRAPQQEAPQTDEKGVSRDKEGGPWILSGPNASLISCIHYSSGAEAFAALGFRALDEQIGLVMCGSESCRVAVPCTPPTPPT